MKYLTVRNLPSELAEALGKEKLRRGTSLNQTVIDLLTRGLGVDANHRRSNGLAELSGGWTSEEHEEFEKAISWMERVESELWD